MNNGEKDDEITMVASPPPPRNDSDITTCYNFGDPLLLEQSIDKAVKNYYLVTEVSKELREILIVLLDEEYSIFQKDAPTNPWEMKEFLNKVIKDNIQTLSKFNKINNRRIELLNTLNSSDSTNDDLEAMLEIYPKIKNNTTFQIAAQKIKQFLSDINVVLVHSEYFINDESLNLVFESIKEFNKCDETIEKLKKYIANCEKEGLIEEPDYYFAKDILNDLTPKTNIVEQAKPKQVKVNNKRLSELLDFIKNNQNYDVTTMNFEDYEKYNILSCHLNLKNNCISCLHNSTSVKNIENIVMLITEEALKGKNTTFKGLIKLLEKEKVPFISHEKLISNKKVIEESLEKLSISCYAQSKIYEKENSWKRKLKLFVATASLISMGIVGYSNDVHIHTPEVIKTQKEMTTKLYEEKRDAIRKMENDVLNSISGRTHKINMKLDKMDNFTDRQIKKIKDKKNRMEDKTKKIIDIIKN